MTQKLYKLKDDQYPVIDQLVGKALKHFRKASNMNQEELANRLGISAQQIQKYEKGSNRISASRLFAISKCLNLNVQDFFKDAEGHYNHPYFLRESSQETYEAAPSLSELLSNKETKNLLECYYKIKDAKVRKYILGLMKAFAQKENEESNIDLDEAI